MAIRPGDRFQTKNDDTVYHAIKSKWDDDLGRYYYIEVLDEQTGETDCLWDVCEQDVEVLTRTDYLTIEMSDSRIWAIPTTYIAQHRARHYAHEFGDDVSRSMEEDTLPLFEMDDYEIRDWATGNMNWEDVEPVAFVAGRNVSHDYQSDWVRTEKVVTTGYEIWGDRDDAS